jgi:class 3 adenylate cyclase/tetratricopeptide (TPR) repeat protein
MACPHCGQANPPSAKFCSGCGARREAVCPACKHGNAPGSRFCNECGTPLASPPVARRSPDVYTPPQLAARILGSRAALEGERKHVTVLFADLKGSMELLADRDPEEARRLLDPVLEHMMEAVHHYEGTVNQVMGDGIMALFGAPLAHEDHAQRACYAALRMQERIARYGDEIQRTQGVTVQIRIGLNSGDVVVRSIGSDLHMDYTAVGETTHLAARMEHAARPGSTLLTVATLRLVEGYVRVRPLGPMALKGLAQPVEVFELLAATGTRTRLEVSATRGLTRFVGRDNEVEQLATALERARGGQGQLVALVGEPGVGKSRVVWEVTHSPRADGWLVLGSAALAYGRGNSFAPVVHLLRAYFGLEGRDGVRRVREKLAGKVLTLDEALRPTLPAIQALLDVPGDDASWTALPADQRRARTVDAVRRLVLRESAVQPLLLVLEDLHWIDPDTHALLEALVDSLPSHPVLLVVNYRPEYRHGWGNRTYYSQIRLDPLPPETAESLLDALLGSDATLHSLRSLLIERAQGNPLFLEESVRTLVETGALAGERGAHRAGGLTPVVQVPPTVHAILASRIDRLSPENKAVLQCAAVVGPDVPLAILEAIVDAPDGVRDALAKLQSAEFVYETRLYPDVEYAFKHALTHEVAYASLVADRRRALHVRVVDAIERLHAGRLAEHRDRLVHHAFRGELWAKAFTHLRHLDEVASAEAIQEVMGEGHESPGRLWWAAEHDRALRTAERDLAIAASFAHFPMRVISTCRLGQAHHALGDYPRAAEMLRQVTASIPEDLLHEGFGMRALPAVFARSYLAWTLAEQGEFVDGAAIAEEALRIAEALDDPYNLGQSAFGVGMHHAVRGLHQRAIPLLERALVTCRLADLPLMFPFLIAPLGAAYTHAGDARRAVSLLEQAVEQGASMQLRAHHALRLTWLARAYLDDDRPQRAGETAQRALQLAQECRERGNEAHALRVVGDIAAHGVDADLPTAEAAYLQGQELAHALGMRPLAAQFQLARGRLARRMGGLAAAHDHLTAAAATFGALGMPNDWIATQGELAALDRPAMPTVE